ncbi:MAG: hypothetical protein U0271_38460 [Polyangiaceae bacterium]
MRAWAAVGFVVLWMGCGAQGSSTRGADTSVEKSSAPPTATVTISAAPRVSAEPIASSKPSSSIMSPQEPPPTCAKVIERAIFTDVTLEESPSARERRSNYLHAMKPAMVAYCERHGDPRGLDACVAKTQDDAAKDAQRRDLRACFGGAFPPR